MSRTPPRHPLRSLLRLLLVGGAVALSLAPALAVAARPQQPFAAAAVFPPWWSPARIDAAVADIGAVTGHGRFAAVVALTGGADLEQRLKQAGAWAVVDPRLAGCAS